MLADGEAISPEFYRSGLTGTRKNLRLGSDDQIKKYRCLSEWVLS